MADDKTTKYAALPNSCNLDSYHNKGWVLQAKPVGADASEYAFVQGLTSLTVTTPGQTADATDLASGHWTYEETVSRTLQISGEAKYSMDGDVEILLPVQRLLKYAGSEVGKFNKVDVRAWRNDIDEGWESTVRVEWNDTDSGMEFRKAGIELQNTCAPTRIHSVEHGSEREASKPVERDEILKVLSPAGASDGDSSGEL